MCVIRCSARLDSDHDWFVWLDGASSRKRPPATRNLSLTQIPVKATYAFVMSIKGPIPFA